MSIKQKRSAGKWLANVREIPMRLRVELMRDHIITASDVHRANKSAFRMIEVPREKALKPKERGVEVLLQDATRSR